jgi:hypothetical protein
MFSFRVNEDACKLRHFLLPFCKLVTAIEIITENSRWHPILSCYPVDASWQLVDLQIFINSMLPHCPALRCSLLLLSRRD